MVHRCHHLRRKCVAERQSRFGKIFRERDPASPTNSDRLAHHVEEEGSRVRMSSDRTDRLTHGGRGSRQPYEENELLPDLSFDVLADRRSDTGVLAGYLQVNRSSRALTTKFPKYQFLYWAEMLYDAWPLHGGGDVAHTPHHGGVWKILQQEFVLLNSVLKRDDRCAAFGQGHEVGSGGFCIPEFHRKKHEIRAVNLRDAV